LILIAAVISLVLASGCSVGQPAGQTTPVVRVVPSGDATAAAIAQEVRVAFGSDLASVSVSSNEASPQPDYIGSFRLRGSKLVFEFRSGPQDYAGYLGDAPRTSLLNDRTHVHNAAIGGNGRFVSLIKRYAADFPGERSMSYWTANEDGSWPVIEQSQGDAINRLLFGRPGPNVIVFDYNDYWSNGVASLVGVYTWDPLRHDWSLLQRYDTPAG
jgi:hypothetical protein